MHPLPIRLALPFAVATALSACAATGAAAAPTRPEAASTATPSAHVRIADGHKRPLELLLPVAERAPSTVEARAGSAFYRVKLSRDGASGSDAPLRFDIERTDREGEGRSNVHVSVTVRMHRGSRAVLAKLSRPDGTTTTITAVLE